MKSIVQDKKECYFCGSEQVELHHIFMGQKHRSLADADGLTVWLCPSHHRGNNGVHMNAEMRLALQKIGQKRYLQTHTMEEWMARYGKNYI